MRQSILIPLNGFNYFGHYAINDRRYNATSVFDYKKTEVETVTADYVIRHGKDWTTRVIYDWNKSMQKMKQTGRGDVTILLPASFAATIPTTFKAASLFLNDRLPRIFLRSPPARRCAACATRRTTRSAARSRSRPPASCSWATSRGSRSSVTSATPD
jgi:hypothetical protein